MIILGKLFRPFRAFSIFGSNPGRRSLRSLALGYLVGPLWGKEFQLLGSDFVEYEYVIYNVDNN